MDLGNSVVQFGQIMLYDMMQVVEERGCTSEEEYVHRQAEPEKLLSETLRNVDMVGVLLTRWINMDQLEMFFSFKVFELLHLFEPCAGAL